MVAIHRGRVWSRATIALLGAPLLLALVAPAEAVEPKQTEASEAPDTSIGWVPLPVIAYTPETSLILGGVSIFTFFIEPPPPPTEDGSRVKRSSVQVVAAVTLKKQYFLVVRPVLYFDGENWQVWGIQKAMWFPQTFWGVGNDTPDDAAEDYTTQHFGSQLGLNRLLISKLRAGVMTSIHHVKIAESETGGLIDTDAVRGSDAGWLVGAGPVLLWDSRP